MTEDIAEILINHFPNARRMVLEEMTNELEALLGSKEKAIRKLIGALTAGELARSNEDDLVQFVQKLEHILDNYELMQELTEEL